MHLKELSHAVFIRRCRAIASEINFSLFCFKGDFGETSERRDGAHMGFSERIDTILN